MAGSFAESAHHRRGTGSLGANGRQPEKCKWAADVCVRVSLLDSIESQGSNEVVMMNEWVCTTRVDGTANACLHELKDDKLRERLKVGEAQPSYMVSKARGLKIANPYAAYRPRH